MRLLRILTGVTSLLVLALPASTSADVTNFSITDFTADYSLSASDPQGALAIDETLQVNFTDNNHGILRALPKRYNGQSLKLHIDSVARDGRGEAYTTYTSNGNEVLKIGDANRTVTGEHTYEIKYHVQNVIRFLKDHDELDWNTNGTEWSQPFLSENARLDVRLPVKPSGLKCYTGSYGGTRQDCTVSGTTFTTERTIYAGETMTFVANFPIGTFHRPTVADWLRDNIGKVAAVVLPVLIAFGLAYRKWHKDGKDLKGRRTIIPEYEPPDGLRPAEADAVNQYKVSKGAVSATIIDLAIRKYLKIIEDQDSGLLGIGKHKTYTLQKLPLPPKDTLKEYEQTIMAGLFPVDDSVELSALKNKFYTTSTAVQNLIPLTLTKAGYFSKNPLRAASWLSAGAIGSFVLAGGLRNWAAIGFAGAGLIFGGFGLLMPRRTQKGVDAKDTLAGLKLYIEVAEKNRLAMLQSPDAPYATKTDAPQQTVELFEKLLPYAMVMGVEKQWAKKFEGIYTSPPDWYGGNWTAFNTAYLVGSLNESVSAMNTSFAAPSSSGSGSGGGFSGGGGGGGGGGGW